jgi:arabinan endo-1,5-alpha-L-arabinosidase
MTMTSTGTRQDRIGLGLLFSMIGLILAAPSARALDGDTRVHDPSTVIQCDGRYYVFTTGRGIPILSSDDGWTWKRSGRVFDDVPDSVHSVVPLNKNALVWAPDICRRNGEYLLYYSISSWGSNVSAIGLMTNPTLNASDPKYKWTDGGLVVNSVAGEKLNAIDPGVLQAPDGTLWLTYGSYIGNVQLVQLDPKTGGRIAKDSPTYILSSQSEASDMIYHDGYYYLFVNRGSCCQGANSSYNIRMGRSKVVTGPYLDRYGVDMAHGGGDLFLAASGTQIGPGHFGLLVDDGLEKFSCHYEADLAKHGSVLDIRPLLWNADGWPAPGGNLQAGIYQARSKRTGLNLQESTIAGQTATVIQQDRYLVRDNQKWELTQVGQYYKLTGVGSKNTLQAAAATVEIAADSGGDDQLWKIDQTSDGTFRILSKANHRALTSAVGGTKPAGIELTEYKADDAQKWILTVP